MDAPPHALLSQDSHVVLRFLPSVQKFVMVFGKASYPVMKEQATLLVVMIVMCGLGVAVASGT